jgi:prevent-host-death family protein
MVNNIVMIKTNVAEIKARLSEYLDRALAGERIVICRHNKPIVELRPFAEVRVEPRPIGPLPGRPAFEVSPSFFDPLPDEDLALWEGASDPGARVPASGAGAPGRVAEKAAPFGRTSKRRPARRRRS